MKKIELPYLPGQSGILPSLPLARFMPPLPAGMFERVIVPPTQPGQWILDPLGTSPLVSLAAARAGYRVLVTSNNPIERFMLAILARAPSLAEMRSALADLAAQRKGEKRLENHIQELYLTNCVTCGRASPAEAFLWKRGEQKPYARLINCPHCQTRGEFPITAEDLDRLNLIGNVRLHRSRALERVNFGSTEAAEGAREALSTYLDRPLYVLFTLLNKIEGLDASEASLDLLRALALSACDAGNSLWSWPSGRERPRQLVTPARFREHNLWKVMEESMLAWCSQAEEVPLAIYPDIPPEQGGICLCASRLKDLLPLPQTFHFNQVIAVLPRPNQAFWTLCALWAGWILGPDQAVAMRIGLERRRYDWQWHANALTSVMRSIRAGSSSSPEQPVFTLIPELETGFLTAGLIGGHMAGFSLQGLAINSEDEIAQISWQISPSSPPTPDKKIDSLVWSALQEHFAQRAEPDEYLSMQAVMLSTLIQTNSLPAAASPLPHDYLSKLQLRLSQIIRTPGWLRRYESAARSEESGLWWPAVHPTDLQPPLADRVEMAVIERLQQQAIVDFDPMYRQLCEAFPGLQTPPQSLVRELISSYTEPDPTHSNRYHLLESELAASRRADVEEMREQLQQLGHRMGYISSGEQPLIWVGPGAQPAYLFYLFASAIVSRFVLAPQNLPPRRCILVFPGSRSHLVEYKLERDPRLKQAAQGWRMLKFRHLRKLSLLPDINLQLWETLLDTDPPQWDEPTQIAMFSDL